MKKTNSLISALKYVFLGNMGQMLITLISTPIIVRLISQNEFGIYTTLLVVIKTLMIIVNIGQADAIRRFAPKYMNKDNSYKSSYINTSSFISKISLILIIVGSLIYYFYSQDLFMTIFIISYLVLYVSFVNKTSFLFALHMQKKSEKLRVLMLFLQYFFAISFAFIYANATSLLIGLFCGLLIPYFILTNENKKIKKSYELNDIQAKRFNKDILKEMLGFGRFVVIGTLFAQLLYNADILLVQHFLGNEDVAVYKAAIIVSQLLWIVPKAFQSGLIPNIAELWEDKNNERISDIVIKSTKFIFIFMHICSIGLLVLAEEFVLLYFGENYIESVLPIKILLIGSLLFGLTRTFDPVVQVAGKLNLALLCSGSAVIINVILNLLLIPVYGILGAAIGTSISFTFIFIFKLIMINYIGIKIRIKLDILVRFIAITILAIIILIFFQSLFNNPFIVIMFTAIFGLATYILLLIFFKIISLNELRILLSTLRGGNSD